MSPSQRRPLPLLNPLPGVPPPVPPPALVAIGTLVPNFPATVSASEQLTGPQISILAMQYGNVFGIVADDTVAERRLKFIAFIAYQ